MTKARPKQSGQSGKPLSQGGGGALAGYDALFGGMVSLLESARHASARSVNAIMTATYWEIGRRIVENEQKGKSRAEYGEALMERLSADLTARFGRGFGRRSLEQMRLFYLSWRIPQSVIAEFEGEGGAVKKQTFRSPIGNLDSLAKFAKLFPLPWTAYVRLLGVRNEHARRFYESEALRSGWSVRQLERQIDSQFYERTALSRNKAAMLTKGSKAKPGDKMTAEEAVKDPYVLEFLGLKDEYSEANIEEALIHHLETFLLELGADFTFAGRQKRLRIDDEWFRVDLVLYHRRLRCLVLIDLKLEKLTARDTGQMHMYLNYARVNWTNPDENPPVGLILCAAKGHDVVRYALDGLPTKILAAEYKTALPDEKVIEAELRKTQRLLESRKH